VPQAESQVIAGIRLPGGELVFVEDAPQTLEIGDVVRCSRDGELLVGSVSIPTRFIVWRDPEARCAVFLSVEQISPPRLVLEPRQPMARLASLEDNAGGFSDKEMLDLAWQDIERLDR
jgi:hypothetical protein